jgi:hypothetical protein
MKQVALRQGTRQHRIAMETLTLTGTMDNIDTFSDLGLAEIWQAYQHRIRAARNA